MNKINKSIYFIFRSAGGTAGISRSGVRAPITTSNNTIIAQCASINTAKQKDSMLDKLKLPGFSTRDRDNTKEKDKNRASEFYLGHLRAPTQFTRGEMAKHDTSSKLQWRPSFFMYPLLCFDFYFKLDLMILRS